MSSDCASAKPSAGVRRRVTFEEGHDRYEPGPEYDSSLPYGGQVYVARRKKPDSWVVIFLEVLVISLTAGLCFYCFYYFDNFHFHVNHFYAHLGYSHAQHIVGQKYLQGHGVERNHSAAFSWLKKAADQGHPHASYNLAIGYLEGLHSHLEEGEAHGLIKHAANHGLKEAKETMEKACSRGDCDVVNIILYGITERNPDILFSATMIATAFTLFYALVRYIRTYVMHLQDDLSGNLTYQFD